MTLEPIHPLLPQHAMLFVPGSSSPTAAPWSSSRVPWRPRSTTSTPTLPKRSTRVIFCEGVKVSPSAAEVAVRAVPCLGLEYRLEHRGDVLALTAEALDDLDESRFAALAHAPQQEFTRLTSLRIPVQLARPGTLARAEMKSRRVVRSQP